MKKVELCPKCKSDYLKHTNKTREMVCSFCGYTETTWTLKDLEELKRSGQI